MRTTNITPVPRQGELPQGYALPDWWNQGGLNGPQLDPNTIPTLDDYRSHLRYEGPVAGAILAGVGMLAGAGIGDRFGAHPLAGMVIGGVLGGVAGFTLGNMARDHDAKRYFEDDFPKRVFEYTNT